MPTLTQAAAAPAVANEVEEQLYRKVLKRILPLLRKTVDFFTDPKVGMIQTRWGHLNRGYSLLTRVQAMFLDGHLVL